MGLLFRDGVKAEFAGEGMAAEEALECEPGAFEYAEAFDGFVGVDRAGGLEAARAADEGGQVEFVKAQGEEGEADGYGLALTREREISRFARNDRFGSTGDEHRIEKRGSTRNQRAVRRRSKSVASGAKGARATVGFG